MIFNLVDKTVSHAQEILELVMGLVFLGLAHVLRLEQMLRDVLLWVVFKEVRTLDELLNRLVN